MYIHNAFITNVAFPMDLQQALMMAQKNEDIVGESISDMEMLIKLSETPESERLEIDVAWTCPKWTLKGDLMIFYHAFTSERRVRHAQIQLQTDNDYKGRDDIEDYLDVQCEIAKQFGGSIFGYAFAGEPLFLEKDEKSLCHFDSQTFARPDRLVLLEKPIPLAKFRHIVEPMRQSTITHVTPQMLQRLIPLLFTDRSVGMSIEYIENSFSNINKSNWRQLASTRSMGFISENQVRSAIIDFFLADIKDEKTPIYRECLVHNKGGKFYADYFICIEGSWIPCEAKLNADLEKDVFGQVLKYVKKKSFKSRDGKIIDTNVSSSIALLCDQISLRVVDATLRAVISEINIESIDSDLYTQFISSARKIILTR